MNNNLINTHKKMIRFQLNIASAIIYYDARTRWPSGLRRWLEAPVRKGVGWNRTGVILEPCWGNLSGELPVFWMHFAVVSPAFWGSNGHIPG